MQLGKQSVCLRESATGMTHAGRRSMLRNHLAQKGMRMRSLFTRIVIKLLAADTGPDVELARRGERLRAEQQRQVAMLRAAAKGPWAPAVTVITRRRKPRVGAGRVLEMPGARAQG